MRVLLLHNEYRVKGGEERHVDLLESGLGAAGVETRRFVASSAALGARPVLRRVASAATLAYSPGAARAVRSVLRDWKPDIVHAHNLFPLLTPAVLREAKNAGAGVVVTAHNYRLFCPAGTLMRRGGEMHHDCVTGSSLMCGLRGARPSRSESVAYGIAVAVQRRLRLNRRWVDAFITPSVHLADTLAAAGFPRHSIFPIANGVVVPPFIRRRREYVLYAGRLAHDKGIHALLRAAAKLPAVPFVLAGDGELRADVAGCGLRNVSYVGAVPSAEVVRLQAKAAVQAVPSRSPEVLPFAALEALAAGVPVVGSGVGGLTEIVSDGAGELVPPDDVDALAAAIGRWWRASAVDADFGRTAWDAARDRYCLERQTARVIDLYRGVAA